VAPVLQINDTEDLILIYKHCRSLIFWDVAWYQLLLSYHCFQKVHWPHLWGSRWPLKPFNVVILQYGTNTLTQNVS